MNVPIPLPRGFTRLFKGPLDASSVVNFDTGLAATGSYAGQIKYVKSEDRPYVLDQTETVWIKMRRAMSYIRQNAIGPITNTRTILGTLATRHAFALNQAVSYRVRLSGSCSAAAAGTHTFKLTYGAANNVATDTEVLSHAITSATSGASIAFCIEMMLTIRNTTQAIGSSRFQNGGTTGLSTVLSGFFQGSQVTITDTPEKFLNVTYQSSTTSNSCTFQQVQIELVD